MSIAEAATTVLAREACAPPLEEIVNLSLPGVRFLANRLAAHLPEHVDVEDLVQIGLVGLLQSANRFDPRRGVKFQTYANRRVEGAMLDYLRSLDWRPRSIRQRDRRLKKAVAALKGSSDYFPTPEEVAQELGIQTSELREWIKDLPVTGTPTVGPSSNDATETEPANDLDWIADPGDSPESIAEKEQMRAILAQAVDHLPDNQRMVLSLYYYEQLTMKEIGQLLGVKQARVSQLHSLAIQRLRQWLLNGDRTDPTGPHSLPPESARLSK